MKNKKLTILIIGGGGREHALAWKLKKSPRVQNIFIAPGNAGTQSLGENISIPVSDHSQILSFARKKCVDLVIIGPDEPLSSGLVDNLSNNGVAVFGPTKNTAKLEWSKSFAKDFMVKNKIPTAKFKIFSNSKEALNYASEQKYPLVIKADGLALGKGVVIASSFSEAKEAINDFMLKKIHGHSGDKIIIEEFLDGREISIHAFCDGKNAIVFPVSQDHKRILDGDIGPNTGGMGAVTPLPWITKRMVARIKNIIIIPILKGLMSIGTPYKGILYPGIMMTKSGPKVIEINARFGDPEAQAYMRILESDLLEIILACIEGKLNKVKVKWKNKFSCCIVAASAGYPGNYKTGFSIRGLDKAEKTCPELLEGLKNIAVFHAGTKKVYNGVATSGGRVLGITATGKTLKEALQRGYKGLKNVSFKGMQFRKDIGIKSLY